MIAIPLDEYVTVRVGELRRFTAALNDRNDKTLRLLTMQKHMRLVLSLRALDGWMLGNSYRAIAIGLFGSHRVPERAWKTHDLRSRTIRLVQDGRALMQERYLDLLLIAAKS